MAELSDPKIIEGVLLIIKKFITPELEQRRVLTRSVTDGSIIVYAIPHFQ